MLFLCVRHEQKIGADTGVFFIGNASFSGIVVSLFQREGGVCALGARISSLKVCLRCVGVEPLCMPFLCMRSVGRSRYNWQKRVVEPAAALGCRLWVDFYVVFTLWRHMRWFLCPGERICLCVCVESLRVDVEVVAGCDNCMGVIRERRDITIFA